MKTFLDSVHGRIKIPKNICNEIIDTPEFQRLRRIEQNSCRSVYPSARHDRFIHSLGVYYIGNLIVEHINTHFNSCLPKDWPIIYQTYIIACLLHDIGHAPFSHTFEVYYNASNILGELQKLLASKKFNEDTNIPIKELTHHELLSGWLSLVTFKDSTSCKNLDWELLVRMIIGVPYKNEKKVSDASNFRNIMIELIHGTIDADGLDYVCRDVWAGGYHNFSVDLHRLIDSIEICYTDKRYILAFSSKSINEVETVLNVKNFQFLYVLNHHKVLLEQHYLVESVTSAAIFHLGIEDPQLAISELCDFKSYISPKVLKTTNYNLFRPCDDDFIALMKLAQAKVKSTFIDQWFSRKHTLLPLWKSKMEFFHIFEDVIEQLLIKAPKDSIDAIGPARNAKEMIASWVGGETCLTFLKTKFHISDKQIFAKIIVPKLRQFDPEKIKISFNGEIIDYSKYTHEGFIVSGYAAPFYYIYIEKTKIEEHSRDAIIDAIKEFIIKDFQEKTNQ